MRVPQCARPATVEAGTQAGAKAEMEVEEALTAKALLDEHIKPVVLRGGPLASAGRRKLAGRPNGNRGIREWKCGYSVMRY